PPPFTIVIQFYIISCQQGDHTGEMAQFMLFSRLKPSMFSRAYAKGNASLSLLQLFRARSTHNISIPAYLIQSATRPDIVWIEIKDGTSETRREDTYWKGILDSIGNEVANEVRGTPYSDLKIVLSGSSMVESLGSHVCAYQDLECTNANTLSIYTTMELGEGELCTGNNGYNKPFAEKIVDIVQEITSNHLVGETYVKIKYEAIIEKLKKYKKSAPELVSPRPARLHLNELHKP
uniref:Uncharacterized protein n=1 Tax=Amphimedon queenslandica TaxID=400682 RepID=A0A1X7UF02_AMPQE